jgi:cytidylate kinase
MSPVIVTIDGPAAAGKSTVARRLAQKLGFHYLDTGATYRAVTWKALQHQVDFDNPDKLVQLANHTSIQFVKQDTGETVLCDGVDVTGKIRKPDVTKNIHYLADEPEVRKALIRIQRDFAKGRDVVTEGRDQGTEVFPDAEVKFYLDASAEARARRRLRDMEAKNIDTNLEETLAAIRKRDQQDQNRQMGGLRRDDDMINIDSTDLTAEQVVKKMRKEIRARDDNTFPDTTYEAPAGQAHA